MYLNQNNFSSTYYPPPPDGLTDSQKEASGWYLKWARHIFSDYVQDGCTIGLGKRAKFATLRAYGNATQPEQEAMGLVFPALSSEKKYMEQKRKGFENIDPTILPIMVKYKYAILGMFQDVEYTLFANAVDKYSKDEKENAKWQLYADKQLKDVIDEVDITTDTPKEDDGSWVPNNVNDLNLYESLGGFRIAAEIGIEKIAGEVVFEADSKERELKEKWIEDAVDIGCMAGITKTDPHTQKVYVDYLMPEYAISKYSREGEFYGQKYGGLFKSVSIGGLRDTGEFKELELKSLANKIRSQQSDKYRNFDTLMRQDETTNTWGYDSMKVDVVQGWVVSDSREYRVRTTSKKGRVLKDEAVKPNYEVQSTKKQRKYHVDTQVLYTFNWVIGTERVYGFGPERDVVYDVQGRPRIPVQIVALRGKSITERCVPSLRNMQVAWIKFQNGLTKSRPPGLAVNYDSLSNMGIKGEKVKGTDILKIALNDGNIVYRATTKHGNINMPGGKPVYELQGGFGTQLDEFAKVFDLNNSFIQEFTGITPESYGGGNVPERQSAMLSELMYNSTNNNLRPIIKKYHDLKLRLAEDVVIRVQNGVRFSKKARDYYTSCVGALYIESLRIPGSKSFREIGISLTLKPDQSMKDRVLQGALEAMKMGKNGQPGISHADYVLLEMMVEHGNLKEAQKRLDITIREAEMRAAKQAQAAQKQNEQHNKEMKVLEVEKTKMDYEHEMEMQTKKDEAEAELKIKLKEMDVKLLDRKIALAEINKDRSRN